MLRKIIWSCPLTSKAIPIDIVSTRQDAIFSRRRNKLYRVISEFSKFWLVFIEVGPPKYWHCAETFVIATLLERFFSSRHFLLLGKTRYYVYTGLHEAVFVIKIEKN